MSKTNILVINDVQQATILAALRFYQQSEDCSVPEEVRDIASDCGAVAPLDPDQIEMLCDQINQSFPSKEAVIQSIVENGFEFSDFVTAFGDRSETNPYVKAASELIAGQGTDFDIDEPAVVSPSEDGAYVMCWRWVANEEAGIIPITEGLWEVYCLLDKLSDARQTPYFEWFGETLSNFADEIDSISEIEIHADVARPIQWDFGGEVHTFLGTEALQSLLASAVEHGLNPKVVKEVESFIADFGDKLDRALGTTFHVPRN